MLAASAWVGANSRPSKKPRPMISAVAATSRHSSAASLTSRSSSLVGVAGLGGTTDRTGLPPPVSGFGCAGLAGSSSNKTARASADKEPPELGRVAVAGLGLDWLDDGLAGDGLGCGRLAGLGVG